MSFRSFFVLDERWKLLCTLFIVLLISIATWWSVKSNLQQKVKLKLELESKVIESEINARIHHYSDGLKSLKAYFYLNGIPKRKNFKTLIQQLNIIENYPGIQGLGFIKGGGAGSKIEMIEPVNDENRALMRVKLNDYPEIQEAIEDAIKLDSRSMSSPLKPDALSPGNVSSQSVFFLFIPYYGRSTLPLGEKERVEKVEGLIFAVFKANDFFNGIFNVPQPNEKINFKVDFIDEKAGTLEKIYERFQSTKARTWIHWTKASSLDVLNIKWLISFTIRSNYLKWSEKMTPLGVGMIVFIFFLLILVTLQATQKHVLLQHKHHEILMETAEKSKSEAVILQRLNLSLSILAADLDIGNIYHKLLGVLQSISKCSTISIYAKSLQDGQNFFELKEYVGASLPAHVDFDSLFKGMKKRSPITKQGLGTSHNGIKVPAMLNDFEDWLVFPISNRADQSIVAVIVLGGNGFFSNDDFFIKILKGVGNQVSATLENARLLKKSEDASLMKNQFIANVSHEIRTPLGAIVGFSEMLIDERIEEKERIALISNIRRNGEQLTRLIDDILDLAKVESGKLEIQNTDVDIVELVTELKSLMDLKAAKRRTRFEIDNSSPFPKYIHTDEIRLRQILLNLVGNAIKFTDHGLVRLRLNFLKTPNGHRLEFIIEDSGIGISEDAQQKLFEAFAQGDASTTRLFGGTGLGLALSRKLARLLGGDLALVESKVGRGSTFKFWLQINEKENIEFIQEIPMQNGQNSEESLILHLKNSLRGYRILLVEDSLDNQEIFKYFLLMAGADVVIAGDGECAIDSVKKESFDLILMDIQIPKIDGKQTASTIRQMGFTRPIIALTAHVIKEEIEDCLRAGCNDHISKPVTGETLIRKVQFFLHS